MYVEDISNENAIDKAFQKNSIFCIKAFVDNLMQLTVVQMQFRNCFDKALLKLIDKGVDAKELVNSNLFYANLWSEYTIFSEQEEIEIKPYNNTLENLEQEEPNNIFYTESKSISMKISEAFKNCLPQKCRDEKTADSSDGHVEDKNDND